MCMRENVIPFNKEIETFMTRMKLESYAFYQNNLLSIYGEKITPCLMDAMTMFEGITRGYSELIIFNVVNIDIPYTIKFILNRMDDIVAGLHHSKEKPVILERELNHFFCGVNTTTAHNEEEFVNEITQLKRTLVDRVENDELLVTLDVLEAELKMNKPRVPVIQGMLFNLKLYPEFRDLRERLAMYYKITK